MEQRKTFMSSVTVGPKGQIVIPKEIREMFSISPGDRLIVMADSTRGIAVQKQDVMEALADAVFAGRGNAVLPSEAPRDQNAFAGEILRVCEEKNDECD